MCKAFVSRGPFSIIFWIFLLSAFGDSKLSVCEQMDSDPESEEPSTSLVKCCDCGCDCKPFMNRSFSGTMLRSIKRKFNEYDERFVIPGLNLPQNARVEIGNECAVLREMVSNQQKSIQNLSVELDEERNAACSAANEAMSMILRLQREKAEVVMEARQFKLLAEEKMAHDQQELEFYEDMLYKKEEYIQSLTCEIEMYKHRMMSFGLLETEADGEDIEGGLLAWNNGMAHNLDGQIEFPSCDYPRLRCKVAENQSYVDVDGDAVDVEKYAFGETPLSRDQLKDLEYRINMLENTPRYSQPDGDSNGNNNVLEKVIVGNSPMQPRHRRKFSTDSTSSFFSKGKEFFPDFTMDSPKFGCSSRKKDHSHPENFSNLRKCDNASDAGDDINDKIYSVESVYTGVTPKYGMIQPVASVGPGDYDMATPRYSMTHTNNGDPDIQKLYTRLHALEADRESMRQAIISMRTDKAQLMLLKEISQELLKEMSPQQRTSVRKSSLIGGFSLISVFKGIVSFIFWRKKARRCKYMCGLSDCNVGLLMLLGNGQRGEQWRKYVSGEPV